ncbi:hypothetical protein WA158_002832 [Blastocystis sp. Blastoise]
MANKILVAIANGSEELESIAIIDVLRRASLDVVVASVESTKRVVMSKSVPITADHLLADVSNDDYDAIVLPGGMPGAENLSNCSLLINMLKQQKESGKWICAICASPAVVFQTHGLIDDVKATAYPGFQKKLSNPVSSEKVVVDKNVITSQGPGTAIDFALEIVHQIAGSSVMKSVKKGLLL